MDLPERDSELFRWAAAAVRSRANDADIVRAESIVSRTGRLYRLHVDSRDGARRYFLKTADANDSAATPTLHYLPAIARAFRGTSPAGFADVVAADESRGWLLMGEVAGISLGVYRRQTLAAFDFHRATRVWRTIGLWLRALHGSMAARVDTLHAEELVSYIGQRFRLWPEQDPAQADLARRAIAAAKLAGAALGTTALVPCHGDVTAGNIIVAGERVTLIDFGDLRFDLPALDLSQAVMETREYGRIDSIVPLPFIGRTSERELRDGYGTAWPAGAAWWLPHLRNLAVYLVTLAPNRRRASEHFRYGRTRQELLRTIRDIERRVHSD